MEGREGDWGLLGGGRGWRKEGDCGGKGGGLRDYCEEEGGGGNGVGEGKGEEGVNGRRRGWRERG